MALLAQRLPEKVGSATGFDADQRALQVRGIGQQLLARVPLPLDHLAVFVESDQMNLEMSIRGLPSQSHTVACSSSVDLMCLGFLIHTTVFSSAIAKEGHPDFTDPTLIAAFNVRKQYGENDSCIIIFPGHRWC